MIPSLRSQAPWRPARVSRGRRKSGRRSTISSRPLPISRTISGHSTRSSSSRMAGRSGPPPLEKPFAQEQWRDTVEGFARRRIELEIAPGRKTAVYLLAPEGKGPFPAVLDVFYYPEDGAGIKEDRRRQNDFGYQLVKRGFVSLCLGQNPNAPRPEAYLYN